MPINDNFPIEKREKSEFKPLPENVYPVELLDVTAEDRPTYDTRNKPDSEKIFEKVLKFQFVLLSGTDMQAEKEEFKNLRGRSVFDNFVQAFLYIGKNGKNKLYQITEALIGRELTLEEEAKFDSQKINELIGMQCRVGIKNKTNSEGKTFSNIDTYYAKEQDLTPLTQEEREKATVNKKPIETTTDRGTQFDGEDSPLNEQHQDVSDIPF